MRRNTIVGSVLLTLSIVVAVAMLADISLHENSRDVSKHSTHIERAMVPEPHGGWAPRASPS
jgi:hypothetical protein